MRYGRIAGWVKIDSYQPGETVAIMTLKNGNGFDHFDLFRDKWSGKWRYDLSRSDSAMSTMEAETGRWYFIEVLVDFGGLGGSRYNAQVRIDGVNQPTIQSTLEVGTTVRAAWFGNYNADQTNTRHYDSLAVEVSDTPLPFIR